MNASFHWVSLTLFISCEWLYIIYCNNSDRFDQKLWYFYLNAIKIGDDSKFRSIMTIIICSNMKIVMHFLISIFWYKMSIAHRNLRSSDVSRKQIWMSKIEEHNFLRETRRFVNLKDVREFQIYDINQILCTL